MSRPAVGRRGGAVLGSPIAHSLSPILHRAAYDALGLADWTYRAVECPEAGLADTLRQLEADGLAGVSLTMPLKRVVLPMLARVERLAADVGAVNTVLFGGVDGEWWGANTDVPGMVAALRGAGVSRPASMLVLGGGATASSAVAAAAALGAADVAVAARRPEALAPVIAVGERFGVAVAPRGWPDAPDALAADVVVSTVPAGATDGLAALVAATTGLLFDVVYAPWPTRLGAAWAAAGGAVVGGLELLVAQAGEQVRLMTGRDAPIAVMRAAGRAALGSR